MLDGILFIDKMDKESLIFSGDVSGDQEAEDRGTASSLATLIVYYHEATQFCSSFEHFLLLIWLQPYSSSPTTRCPTMTKFI